MGDYKAFVVRIATADIPSTLDVLAAFTPAAVAAMQRAVHSAQSLLTYSHTATSKHGVTPRTSAFNMLAFELWRVACHARTARHGHARTQPSCNIRKYM